MAASRPVSNNIKSAYKSYELHMHSNKHVSSEKLRKGDVESFNQILEKYSPGLSHVLMHTSSEFILKNMFPSCPSSYAVYAFLRDSYFVIRHPDGIYKYPHGNDTEMRTRYEVRLNFYGLFILSHYNLVFRTFSVPQKNNIGRWEQVLPFDIEKCQIDFIPRKSENFTYELYMVASVVPIANQLSILPQMDVFKPQKPQLDLGKLNIKLQQALKDTLPALQNAIEEFVNQPVLQSASSSEDVEMKSEDDAVLPEFLQQLCEFQGNDVILSVPSSSTVHDQIVLKDYYEFLRFVHISYLSKLKKDTLAYASQDYTYTPNTPEKMPANASTVSLLTRWMNGILSAISDKDHDEFISGLAMDFTFLLTPWTYSATSIRMSRTIFDSILTPKVRGFLQARINANPIQELKQKLVRRDQLLQASSEDLLRELLSQSEYSENAAILVRKLAVHNARSFAEIKKELLDMQDSRRVKPATMMVSGLPIQTYDGQWKERSGLVLLTGKSNAIAMAGFKRPANSNFLKDTMIPLGFPSSTAGLREIGGKPSFNYSEFHRRLMTIHLRKTSQFPDKSRKDFFHEFFMKSNSVVLNEPLKLNNLEKMYLKNNIPFEDVTAPHSEHFTAYLVLREQVKTELNLYLKGKHKHIHQYYLQLLESMMADALNQSDKSIKDILAEKRRNSYITRRALLRKYNMHPSQLGLATSGRQYHVQSAETVYSSNEVLLQGLNTVNRKKVLVSDTMYPLDLDPMTIAVRELLSRHGNTVAIFANTTRVNGKKNKDGIIQAMQQWLVFEEVFGQRLPFAMYDEKLATWEVLSKDAFQEKFLQKIEIVLSGVAPDFSFEIKYPEFPDLDMAMTPAYLKFLIECILSSVSASVSFGAHIDASGIYDVQELAKSIVSSYSAYVSHEEINAMRNEVSTLYERLTKTVLMTTVMQDNILDPEITDILKRWSDNLTLKPEKLVHIEKLLKAVSIYQSHKYTLSKDDPDYALWRNKSIELVLMCVFLCMLDCNNVLLQKNVVKLRDEVFALTHQKFYAQYVKHQSLVQASPTVVSSSAASSSASAIPHQASSAAAASSSATAVPAPVEYCSKAEKKKLHEKIFVKIQDAIKAKLLATLTTKELGLTEYDFRIFLTVKNLPTSYQVMKDKAFNLSLDMTSSMGPDTLELLVDNIFEKGIAKHCVQSAKPYSVSKFLKDQIKNMLTEPAKYLQGEFEVNVGVVRFKSESKAVSRPLTIATGNAVSSFANLPPTGPSSAAAASSSASTGYSVSTSSPAAAWSSASPGYSPSPMLTSLSRTPSPSYMQGAITPAGGSGYTTASPVPVSLNSPFGFSRVGSASPFNFFSATPGSSSSAALPKAQKAPSVMLSAAAPAHYVGSSSSSAAASAAPASSNSSHGFGRVGVGSSFNFYSPTPASSSAAAAASSSAAAFVSASASSQAQQKRRRDEKKNAAAKNPLERENKKPKR
ncbi:MAG: hypothetical protein P4M12_12065 [Gammaproteobacteria bacterium]|nr:hypothetical protein [Gammaproteobacteria bacterium]